MKPINMMKRTDCFGDPVTLQAWLSQLGKWRRLEQRIGALSSAAVWQMPVPDCIGWSFEAFGTRANGWCVLEIETGKCVSDVWHGLPDALLYSDPNHQWPHGVVLPQSCRIDHWN